MNRVGYVYLVQAGSVCKIGFTRNVQQRLKRLESDACGRRVPFKEHWVVRVKFPQSVEGRLHVLFASQCVGGEWFSLTESDIRRALLYALGVPEEEPEKFTEPEPVTVLSERSGLTHRYASEEEFLRALDRLDRVGGDQCGLKRRRG